MNFAEGDGDEKRLVGLRLAAPQAKISHPTISDDDVTDDSEDDEDEKRLVGLRLAVPQAKMLL